MTAYCVQEHGVSMPYFQLLSDIDIREVYLRPWRDGDRAETSASKPQRAMKVDEYLRQGLTPAEAQAKLDEWKAKLRARKTPTAVKTKAKRKGDGRVNTERPQLQRPDGTPLSDIPPVDPGAQ